MAYDPHAAKRMKTDSNGFGSSSRGRGNPVGGYNYPGHKPDRPPRDYGQPEERPNNVLLFTVLNPQYPITVDVMHTICSSHGKVDRIVIFKKQGVQAMVEFESIESAEQAKQALQGADIYSGCCTLKIEFARTSRLNVVRNDTESWDYTNPTLSQEMERRSALLPDPGPPGSYDARGRDPYDRYGGRVDDPYSPRDRYPPQERYGDSPRGDPYGRGGPPDDFRRGPPRDAPPYGGRDPGGFRGGAGDQAPLTCGMGQDGAVLMLYGLSSERMNCQRLFNLLCLYGNVVRIKFLKSKEGTAMVQMGDPPAMERVMRHLNNTLFFDGKLMIGFSKQTFLQTVPNPVDLPDGSKSFQDFTGSRCNRYLNPEAAAKNRIQGPARTVYYWNAPPGFDEDGMMQIFDNRGVKRPSKIKIFPSKTEKSSTGLMEWDELTDATEAIVCCNHTDIDNPKGKYPFTLKMCFSSNTISTVGPGGKRPFNEN